MLVFLDFEASSLARKSYPIEVAWVFADGRAETHLICPAPEWTDWDAEAEALHHIDRQLLNREGKPPGIVAQRMIDTLAGHDLVASAPSWDGKWLSALLRAGGHARHSLRLRGTDAALRETACEILAPALSGAGLDATVDDLIALVEVRQTINQRAHRALADAQGERALWEAVRDRATHIGATANIHG